MGTRSLTAIKDEDDKDIMVLYVHRDGDPDNYGTELAEFLSGFVITNGVINQESKKEASGMECLAAQIVKRFKTCVGNVYIMPAGSRRLNDEYLYIVSYRNQKLEIKILTSKTDSYSDLFLGTPEELLVFFRK